MLGAISHHLCYAMARAFLRPPLNRFGFRAPTITRNDSLQHFLSDRQSTIHEYAALFSPFTSFKGKVVMELGCSSGYLLHAFLAAEGFTAIGADNNAEALSVGQEQHSGRIQFVQTTLREIPLPSGVVDIVYCIDTIEHLSQPREMLLEVYRVLKPGGLALIHFCPWSNPYGSHLTEIIPFPWPHVLFSMDTLLSVASRIYDLPDYQVAWYYLDQKTGQKKPNPYKDLKHWDSFLNRMSIRQFNRLIRTMPFQYVHQERIGFGGKTFKLGRVMRLLARLPVADEFFSYALYTVLQKPLSEIGRTL